MDDQALEHLGRQPGEAHKAADVAVGQALVGGEIGERGDVAALQPLPPAPCPANGAQQVRILPVRRQGFSDFAGRFVTEALVRFLFKFKRQLLGAASGVAGLSVS